MGVLAWDQTGERFFETGVDRGVLFRADRPVHAFLLSAGGECREQGVNDTGLQAFIDGGIEG